MRSSHAVRIPFCEPRPANDVKWKLAFIKPTSINVIGSYALKTCADSKERLSVDLAVTMPSVGLPLKIRMNPIDVGDRPSFRIRTTSTIAIFTREHTTLHASPPPSRVPPTPSVNLNTSTRMEMSFNRFLWCDHSKVGPAYYRTISGRD